MNTFTTDIAKRETLATMIGTYQQATSMVEKAYAILEQAQNCAIHFIWTANPVLTGH